MPIYRGKSKPEQQKEYPLGNAYCLVPIGRSQLVFREYARRFPKGVQVHIDHEMTAIPQRPKGVTGRQLLQRFYDLQPRPISFKLEKSRNKFVNSRWLVAYPMHFMVIMEISEKAGFADDHECTLYYVNTIHRVMPGKDRNELIPIAHQLYRGFFLQGQPDDLRGELKEWREEKQWFQNANLRDAVHEI